MTDYGDISELERLISLSTSRPVTNFVTPVHNHQFLSYDSNGIYSKSPLRSQKKQNSVKSTYQHPSYQQQEIKNSLIYTLKERVEVLEQENKVYKQATKKLERLVDDSTNKLNELAKDKEISYSKYISLVKANENLREELLSQKLRSEDAISKSCQLADELSMFKLVHSRGNTSHHALEEQLEHFKEQYQSYKSNISQQLIEKDHQISYLQLELNKYQHRRMDISEDVTMIKQERDDLVTLLSESRNEISKYRKLLEDSQNKIIERNATHSKDHSRRSSEMMRSSSFMNTDLLHQLLADITFVTRLIETYNPSSLSTDKGNDDDGENSSDSNNNNNNNNIRSIDKNMDRRWNSLSLDTIRSELTILAQKTPKSDEKDFTSINHKIDNPFDISVYMIADHITSILIRYFDLYETHQSLSKNLSNSNRSLDKASRILVKLEAKLSQSKRQLVEVDSNLITIGRYVDEFHKSDENNMDISISDMDTISALSTSIDFTSRRIDVNTNKSRLKSEERESLLHKLTMFSVLMRDRRHEWLNKQKEQNIEIRTMRNTIKHLEAKLRTNQVATKEKEPSHSIPTKDFSSQYSSIIPDNDGNKANSVMVIIIRCLFTYLMHINSIFEDVVYQKNILYQIIQTQFEYQSQVQHILQTAIRNIKNLSQSNLQLTYASTTNQDIDNLISSLLTHHNLRFRLGSGFKLGGGIRLLKSYVFCVIACIRLHKLVMNTKRLLQDENHFHIRSCDIRKLASSYNNKNNKENSYHLSLQYLSNVEMIYKAQYFKDNIHSNPFSVMEQIFEQFLPSISSTTQTESIIERTRKESIVHKSVNIPDIELLSQIIHVYSSVIESLRDKNTITKSSEEKISKDYEWLLLEKTKALDKALEEINRSKLKLLLFERRQVYNSLSMTQLIKETVLNTSKHSHSSINNSNSNIGSSIALSLSRYPSPDRSYRTFGTVNSHFASPTTETSFHSSFHPVTTNESTDPSFVLNTSVNGNTSVPHRSLASYKSTKDSLTSESFHSVNPNVSMKFTNDLTYKQLEESFQSVRSQLLSPFSKYTNTVGRDYDESDQASHLFHFCRDQSVSTGDDKND